MKIIRLVLGNLILAFDALFSPTPISREPTKQVQLNEQTKNWTLYHLKLCPFCVKVRRQMKRLAIQIPMKDVGEDERAQQELMEGGKIDQVPCLRYLDSTGKVQWMYESNDINQFLQTLGA